MKTKTVLIFLLIFKQLSLFSQVKFDNQELTDPIEFGRLLVYTSQEGTLSQWENLLHPDFVALGTNFTKEHFSIWQQGFKPTWNKFNKKSAIPESLEDEFSLKIDGNRITVKKENGRYYLNER